MSIAVHLSKIPPAKAKLLAKHLTVIEESNKDKNYFSGSMIPVSKPKSVEAFELVEHGSDYIAYLPFSYVYHYLSSCLSVIEYPTIDFQFNGQLLDRQKDIRDETFDILNRTQSILLCLHTGFGKTIYALYLASKIKLKTLILCHRTIIIDQWVSSVEKYLPNVSVGIWSPKLKGPKKGPLPDILVANVLNLKKWTRADYAEYGLVILDEIHTMCTTQLSVGLLYLTPKYVIGLSATPFRSDGMDRLIELFVGPEIVYRPMQKIFNVYQLRTGFEIEVDRESELMDANVAWNAILEAQANHAERNTLICDLIRIFSHRVILVLVKRVDHAKWLCHYLKQSGEDADVFLGTSKNVNYDCRILVASFSKAGVGFDHPRLDMLIVAADILENYTQYVGRVFRRDSTTPIIIDLIDKTNTMRKHAQSRKAVCEELGGTIHNFKTAFKDFERYRSFL